MVSNVPVALFTDKGGSNSAYAGAIGTLVLDNFKATINYSQKVMILSGKVSPPFLHTSGQLENCLRRNLCCRLPLYLRLLCTI